MALSVKTPLLTLALAGAVNLSSVGYAETGEISPEIQATMDRFRAAVAELEDATRSEWLNGSYRPYQELELSYRASGDIYIRFSGKNSHGREVMWRPSVDPDVLLVKPSPFLPALQIPPDGILANKDSRHHVGMATFHALEARILGEFDKLVTDPNLSGTFTELPQDKALDRDAHCFQVDLPRDQEPSLYANRIELCFDRITDLPVTLRAWESHDESLRLVEDYSWSQIHLNPGLDDKVFDRDNPDYNF
jgi:hypothetical protein